MESELKGLRGIGWLRCSTDRQSETSIPDQETTVRRFAAQHGFTLIDFVRLEGMSASIETGLDEAVASLIRRKLGGEHFDLLVVYDSSRFSRTGANHAAKMTYELERAGIFLVPVMEYEPRNEFSAVTRSMRFVTSNVQSRKLSETSTRGQQSSLDGRRRAHCGTPPYGIDRLILSADDRPLYVVRQLPGGIQVRLNPETGEEIERSFLDASGKHRGRFPKHRDQRVVLVPGAPEARQAVSTAFELYYLKGWGVYRIARYLNDAGIPSPRGLHWGTNTVTILVRNPTYLGKGFANREARGVYFKRGPQGPTEVARGPLGGGPQVRVREVRPRKEWLELEYPQMVDYLPPEVRDVAAKGMEELLDRTGTGRVPRPRKTKHIESKYFLSGVLRVKGSGDRMGGVTKDGRRYYVVPKTFQCPLSSRTAARSIRADILEAFVLEQVQIVLSGVRGFRDHLISETRTWMTRLARGGDSDLLRKELAEIEQRIEFVDTEIVTFGVEAARRKLALLSARRAELRAAFATTDVELLSEDEIVSAVDAVVREFESRAATLREVPPHQLRQFLATFVQSAEVDLEDRRLELVVRVPSWSWSGKVNPSPACRSGADHPQETPTSDTFLRYRAVLAVPKQYHARYDNCEKGEGRYLVA